VINSSHRKERL